MKYNIFGKTNCNVSRLGFGAMRLPTSVEGDNIKINEDEAIKIIRYAIDNGINYIDTAYFYHNGESEIIVGKALKDGYRNKVYLATKLPMCEVDTADDFDRLLNEQLNKLNTDYIDFYLFHALNADHWEKVKKLGLINKMQKAKISGKIRHIGFSFHDNPEIFIKIIDEYEGCEFCQIQLNYLDIDHQAGINGLLYANSKGLGTVIMEPLQGGRLANISESIQKYLPKGKNAVENALSFLWDKNEVNVVLSGMSNFEQVKQNIDSSDKFYIDCLTEDERNMYTAAKIEFDKSTIVPCTGCNYCQPCKQGVLIPKVFKAYNKVANGGLFSVRKALPEIEELIAKCIKCGECENMCPQQINIIEKLKTIQKRF